MKKAGLKLKPSKCSFCRKRIKYLGFIVSEDGISTDPEKVEKVLNWPVPINRKQVRGFAGFTSYYRRFICNYAEKAAPLYKLTKKGEPFVWTSECQKSFDQLKQDITSPPIFAYPNFNYAFALDKDASGHSISGGLSQVQDG